MNAAGYDRNLGFGSAVSLRYANEREGREPIRRLLQDGQASPSSEARIDVGHPMTDGDSVMLPLRFHTRRQFKFEEAVLLAAATVAFLRQNVGTANLGEVCDDAGPTITTTGSWPL